MGLRSAVLALGCALAVSCGGLQSSSPPATPPPTGALTVWKDFPVTRNPRPIILLENVTPGQGFSSGDGKLAFVCGKFAASAPLPTTSPPRARVTWADGTYETFTGVSANDAFIAMGANVRGKSTDCTTVPPLSVTQTRFGSETYETDRGPAQITSWLFTAPGAWREIAYPALPSSAIWGGGWSDWSGDSASISADGLSLTFGFTGAKAGNGPCEANYRGVVAESVTAVAVAPQELSNPNQPAGGACTAEGYPRRVTVSLNTPLGGRVVVDRRSAVLAVCREGVAC